MSVKQFPTNVAGGSGTGLGKPGIQLQVCSPVSGQDSEVIS